MAAKQEKVCCDGNESCAWVAYAVSDCAVIYPITPSSGMGELADTWSGANQMNIFGQATKVVMMQSEAGAVGAVHGSLTAGALTTTFTASQGLLLMIPNMYKIAGELLPCVFHVAARAIAGQALSIFGDHSDVMACRQTGFAMLSSHSVQEAHDMALVAHIAALEAGLPFLHFFDGFRTSHELDDISRLDYATIKSLINHQKIKEFKDRAVNPDHPDLRGTSQAPDIFFQLCEASNALYNRVPEVVKTAMAKVSEVTGRTYHTFDYVGAKDAENVIVVMGSGALTVEEVVLHLVEKQSAKIGVIKVHLYRPWVAADFLAAIPATCKRLAVLDRTKEPGCYFEPLALDVLASVQQAGRNVMVCSGRYGLGSKDFTAGMVKSVYDNLAAKQPKTIFTVGIIDDVTHLSLPWNEDLNTVPEGTIECMFWGMGADGTVGANRNSIKVITDHTDLHTQGYFVFDAHKSGGVTVSHLRFGPKQINSIYLLQHANFIAIHHETYPEKYGARLVKQLRKGGIVLLNTKLTPEECLTQLPGDLRKTIAEKEGKLYIIDALHECEKLDLGKHINILMQVCFFHLSKVIPADVYIKALKDAIKKTYYKKGPEVIAKNQLAVDHAISALKEVKYNAADWLKGTKPAKKEIAHAPAKTDFIKNILDPMIDLEGDDLPVSIFTPGGVFPMGTTKYEKRGLAFQIPFWDYSTCIQCNKCATVCPHACIRPVLMTQEEIDAAPHKERITSLKAQGREAAGYRFRIQVSPLDCTGCKVCSEICPSDCLKMTELTPEIREKDAPIWNYFMELPERGQAFERTTIKGAQFRQPLLEFSGACDGCGETAYVKLLTQLFGERMIIANATGCSSIWGGTVGTNPYTVRKDNGRGIGWANSLFEDNAEYGYGMACAYKHRRAGMKVSMENAIKSGAATGEMKTLFEQWMANMDNAEVCEEVRAKLLPMLKNLGKDANAELQAIADRSDMIVKPSQWIIGGDGWAYDIGYGGLDHVLHQGEKVNIMVLDTEMYSNTGGQMSKSTPMGAVVKFAAAGKRTMKKDLGKIAMANEQCYVASIAMEADQAQAMKAIVEAEAYPGTSIIIAYAPCIAHGMSSMDKGIEASKLAVDSGYWPLYRYNPSLIAKGENPLQIDSGRLKEDVQKFLDVQNRFTLLQRADAAMAKELNSKLVKFSVDKFNKLKKQSVSSSVADLKAGLAGGKRGDDSLVILYASEGGNAAGVANRMSAEGRARGLVVECMPANEFAIDDLSNVNRLLFVGSTCGQGEIPENAKAFYKDLTGLAAGSLAGVKFAVFGLGDAAYRMFNLTAKLVDEALAAKGATRMAPTGLGDDQDADKYETKLEEFEPEFWEQVGKKRLSDAPAEASFKVEVGAPAATALPQYVPTEATLLKLSKKYRMTPEDHDREIAHYEIDLAGSNFKYGLCDAIAIWGETDPQFVEKMITLFNLNKDARVKIEALATADKKLAKELPKETTIKTLFTEILDISGRPSSRFYSGLAYYANDADKKAINALLADKAAFRKMVDKEKVNYVDLFERFPSARPPLERLIEMIPLIRARLYSCASSPRMHPTTAELCIVTVDWVPEKDGTKMPLRKGLTTGYLGRVKAGDILKVGLKPSAMNMPEEPTTPVVTAALGTGLAPFRAMIQERSALKKSGKAIGELAVYYGCRYKAKEYLYGEEFENYEKEHSLTHLRPAFSRDQAKKVYINDKIREDADYLYKSLVQEKGSFFYCGPAGDTPKGVRDAIKDALIKGGKATAEQAEAWIVEMESTGRYVLEAY